MFVFTGPDPCAPDPCAPNVVHDDWKAINVTFGSVPQSVIGKPQASTPLCAGKSFGSESFIKRDFSLKVAFPLKEIFNLLKF